MSRAPAVLLVLCAGGAVAADPCAPARAHVQAWQLDAAAEAYAGCIDGADPKALLEFAEVETYRGDRRHARRLLDRYRAKAGATDAWRRAEAAFLARAGRPRQALDRLPALIGARPDEYDLRLAHALALDGAREPARAQAELAVLQRLGPARPETRGAALQVNTPLRPRAGIGTEYYEDTSGISIAHSWFEGKLAAGDSVDLLLQGNLRELGADRGSGYETPAGELGARQHDAALVLRWRPSGDVLLEGAGGRTWLEPEEGHPLYRGRFEHWIGDAFHWSASATRDVLAISPLAAALGIERDEYVAAAEWSLGWATVVEGRIAIEDYSDGNRRWEGALAPRRAVMRTQRHNLDLGLYGQWLGYDENLANGYYDPSGFERYWAVGYYYWKGGDDYGIGVSGGLGPEQDADFNEGFRLGGNLYVGGTWGVYRDWQIRAWGSYGSRVERGADEEERPHGYSAGLEVTRRF